MSFDALPHILLTAFTDPYRVVTISVLSSIFFFVTLGTIKLLFPKKKLSPLLLIFLLALLPTINTFRTGTYRAGDLSYHESYFRMFYSNIASGILIPRWAADVCAGYGCPVFMFEYIFPHYIATIFHLVGFSFLDSIKLVLVVFYIASGFSMYFFAKDELGEKGGLIAAIFYLFAPYHLIDLNFRATIGEIPAFFLIPLLFLLCKKIIQKPSLPLIISTAVAMSCLILTHIPSLLAISPILMFYCLLTQKRLHSKYFTYHLYSVSGTGILALLFTSFYWLPALAEARYTWYSVVGPAGDFKPFLEYMYSPIAYGLLFQGHHGEFRLIIGYTHLLVMLASIVWLIKADRNMKYRPLLLLLISSFIVLLLLMQSFSKPLWDAVPLLNVFLSVWRLLTPIAFITSLTAGLLLSKMRHKTLLIGICAFTVFSTLLNWGNRFMIPNVENPDLSQHMDLYTEYFEKGNPVYETYHKEEAKKLNSVFKSKRKAPLVPLMGKPLYKQIVRSPVKHTYLINADSSVRLEDTTNYFPGWTVTANGKEVPIAYQNKLVFGKITFSLSKGLYLVSVVFSDTLVRKIGDTVSLVSLLSAGAAFFWFVFRIDTQKLLKRKRRTAR